MVDYLTIFDLMFEQDDFLTRLWGKDYKYQAPEVTTQRAKDLAVHMMTEMSEFLNELPFKSHRIYVDHRIDKARLAEEAIDILKYLLGLCLNMDIDARLLQETWIAKSNIVCHRLKQEQALEKARLERRSLAVLDLDGVILDSHTAWLDWVHAQTGRRFKTRMMARVGLGNEDYEGLKDTYRRTEKATIPQFRGMDRLVDLLHQRGLLVVIVTARPFNRYVNLLGDTVESLRGIDYDLLFADAHKRERLRPHCDMIRVVIEDDLDQAIGLSNPWTTTLLIRNDENRRLVVPEGIVDIGHPEGLVALISRNPYFPATFAQIPLPGMEDPR